jgi:hypothetical protein
MPKAVKFAADATREMDDYVRDLKLVDSLKEKALAARKASLDVRKNDAARLAAAAFNGSKASKPTAMSPMDDAADLAERIAAEASLMPEDREKERRARVRKDMAELALDLSAHVESYRAKAEADVRRAIRRFEALVGANAAEAGIREASRRAAAPFAMGIRDHLIFAMEKQHVRYLTAAVRQSVKDLEHVCAEMARED